MGIKGRVFDMKESAIILKQVKIAFGLIADGQGYGKCAGSQGLVDDKFNRYFSRFDQAGVDFLQSGIGNKNIVIIAIAHKETKDRFFQRGNNVKIATDFDWFARLKN